MVVEIGSMACEGESGPGPFKKGLRVNQTSQQRQRAGRCARYSARELGGGVLSTREEYGVCRSQA